MTKIGILGAGQLGRMLAAAASSLGLATSLYDPNPEACALQAFPGVCASFQDESALSAFARSLDVCTYEFENVPLCSAELVSRHCPLRPGLRALEVSQDRLVEKEFLQSLGIPTAPFRAVSGPSQMRSGLLKTRRLGYDGKGQVDVAQVEDAWKALGEEPAIWEEKVSFERELSVLAVRSLGGEMAFYPVIETVQREGVLTEVVAPARGLPRSLESKAREIAEAVLVALDYVGVLAVELFQVGDTLLANEMAPRVHNSGHWTDRGAHTSQFENHIRAICGWRLGNTEAVGASRLVNWLGRTPDRQLLPRPAGWYPQFYGKQPRPGRKVGHLTLVGTNEEQVDRLWRDYEQSNLS